MIAKPYRNIWHWRLRLRYDLLWRCRGSHTTRLTEAHGKIHWWDVNGDGRQDLLLHFEVQQTGIDAGDMEACLTGRIRSGQLSEGCETIQIR